jgi:hypothetical protein
VPIVFDEAVCPTVRARSVTSRLPLPSSIPTQWPHPVHRLPLIAGAEVIGFGRVKGGGDRGGGIATWPRGIPARRLANAAWLFARGGLLLANDGWSLAKPVEPS